MNLLSDVGCHMGSVRENLRMMRELMIKNRILSGLSRDYMTAFVLNLDTDEYTKVMLLFHDTEAKESTIEALPSVMEYYKNLGYSFKAIDRESLVVHHGVNN